MRGTGYILLSLLVGRKERRMYQKRMLLFASRRTKRYKRAENRELRFLPIRETFSVYRLLHGKTFDGNEKAVTYLSGYSCEKGGSRKIRQIRCRKK